MPKSKIEINIPANSRFSGLVRHMAKGVFSVIGFNKEWAQRLELVVDELFMNASRYGSKENESTIRMEFSYDDKELSFSIEDEGMGEKKITAAQLRAIVEKNIATQEVTKTSGRGLALITKPSTDSMDIRDGSKGGIIINFIKKIDPSVPPPVPHHFNTGTATPVVPAAPSSPNVVPPAPEADNQKPSEATKQAAAAPAQQAPPAPVIPDGPTFTIKVNGDTDALDMRAIIDPIAKQVQALPGGGVLVLNFEDVDYINSTFIGHLASWYNDVQSKKGRIILRNINDQIRDILDLVGLSKIIVVDA